MMTFQDMAASGSSAYFTPENPKSRPFNAIVKKQLKC
jgi:hypothetical protein